MSSPQRNQTHQSIMSPHGSERTLVLDSYLILKVIAVSRKHTIIKRTNGACTYIEVKVMFVFEKQVISFRLIK